MSFIELTIIVLITIGIIDKNKIKKLYKTIANIQNGPTRKIIGDQSLKEDWIWIDRPKSEEE